MKTRIIVERINNNAVATKSKTAESKELADRIKLFLDGGGVILQIPPGASANREIIITKRNKIGTLEL